MRPDINDVPDSLGDIFAALWAALPVDGYFISAVVGVTVFAVAWVWRTVKFL